MVNNLENMLIIDGKKYYKHYKYTKYASSKDGSIINIKTKRIIKTANCNGYLYFNLCDESLLKPKFYYQHRFVYEVFNGSIPKLMEIDHRNGVKNDNKISNLQLLTHKQNVEKSNNKPIISICIKNGEKIRFDSIKKASIELDINSSSISKICCKINKSSKSKKNGCKYTFKFQ